MSQDRVMNVFFLFTGSGSLVILTSYSSVEDPALLRKLAAKGIEKFLAYQIPITLAKERYGTHFDIVSAELSESDDLRVLDFDGTRAFRLFRFEDEIRKTAGLVVDPGRAVSEMMLDDETREPSKLINLLGRVSFRGWRRHSSTPGYRQV